MTSLTQQKERERTAGRDWTPGPLTYDRYTGDIVMDDELGARVAMIDLDNCANKDQAHADGRLFAAAPELFEALATFVEEYCALVNSGDAGNWDPDQEPKVIAARSALQLARGEKGDE